MSESDPKTFSAHTLDQLRESEAIFVSVQALHQVLRNVVEFRDIPYGSCVAVGDIICKLFDRMERTRHLAQLQQESGVAKAKTGWACPACNEGCHGAKPHFSPLHVQSAHHCHPCEGCISRRHRRTRARQAVCILGQLSEIPEIERAGTAAAAEKPSTA